jgi:putative component of membrane protein insertase Oxa1/YidC/SpoIIIJ protein YidD
VKRAQAAASRALAAVIVAAWRLLRCNPFSHGGYDPVEARTLFSPDSDATTGERTRHA